MLISQPLKSDGSLASMQEGRVYLQHPESSSSLHPRGQDSSLAITRLPREILESIFEDCLPQEGWCKPYAGEMPLVLGRVCGTWRHVVHTTPRMWTSLTLSLSPDIWYEVDEDLVSVAHAARLVCILHSWLDRANEHSIRLNLSDEHPMDVDTILPIAELLCSNAHRWRSLHLLVDDMPSFSLFFETVLMSNLPALTEASMRVRTGPVGEHWHSDVQRISSSNLSHLISFSWDIPVAPARSLTKAGWGRLTELSLFYNLGPHDSWQELGHNFDHSIFKVLRHTKSLATLNIGIADNQPYIENPRTVLPLLSTLRLRRRSVRAKVGNAASRFSFPMLRRLEIDSDPALLASGPELGSYHWVQDALKGLLSRPGCALQALSLCDTHITEEGIVEILDRCPELKELALVKNTGWSERSAVLYYLLGRLKNREWIPHLETLRIGTPLNFCTPLRSIVDVAGARRDVLRDVVVTLTHPEGEGEDQYDDVVEFMTNLDRLSEHNLLRSTVTVSVSAGISRPPYEDGVASGSTFYKNMTIENQQKANMCISEKDGTHSPVGVAYVSVARQLRTCDVNHSCVALTEAPSDTNNDAWYWCNYLWDLHSEGMAYTSIGTLVVYDWIIFLDQEIHFIWKRKWNLVKVLYIALRVVGAIYGITNVFNYAPIHVSDTVCIAFAWIIPGSEALGFSVLQATDRQNLGYPGFCLARWGNLLWPLLRGEYGSLLAFEILMLGISLYFFTKHVLQSRGLSGTWSTKNMVVLLSLTVLSNPELRPCLLAPRNRVAFDVFNAVLSGVVVGSAEGYIFYGEKSRRSARTLKECGANLTNYVKNSRMAFLVSAVREMIRGPPWVSFFPRSLALQAYAGIDYICSNLLRRRVRAAQGSVTIGGDIHACS
ncbi:hypothetical protein CONPUDRAFT_147971 [Coniophora puteana RWD-64-598 SS2]|uniref:DUF6533 domain-containing protein n=1 Tax=Coniophora puteana (strain RWD-64-598) TaxID=741705 RepID=R7SE38_CONPW|nr:uncharacterized protein CONPUDRAFT_147971 [Coniophora puteana RWD-64-598 SS2]EIW74012.1 hypothetical protein CONPUDRAFT_147971 [Coniophora puteana RWD-64-598 SS2]